MEPVTDMNELYELTKQWHRDRKITINGKAETQLMKLVEELGEVAAAMARNKRDGVIDGLGDMLVVMVALAELSNASLLECWYQAYQEIKDRNGYLAENGNFIKEADYVNQ